MLPQVQLLIIYLIIIHSFLLPEFFFNDSSYKKQTSYKFNENSFLYDFSNTNWNFVMEIDKNDCYYISFSNYLYKVNSIVMSHVSI